MCVCVIVTGCVMTLGEPLHVWCSCSVLTIFHRHYKFGGYPKFSNKTSKSSHIVFKIFFTNRKLPFQAPNGHHQNNKQHFYGWNHLLLTLLRQLPLPSFSSSAGITALVSVSTLGDFKSLASSSAGGATSFGDITSDSDGLFLPLKKFFMPEVILPKNIQRNSLNAAFLAEQNCSDTIHMLAVSDL